MQQLVSLPLWLVVVLAALAGWAEVSDVLLPIARAILAWPSRSVLAEAERRLAIPIQPFKLTKREVLLDRLAYDPLVMEAVDQEARETGASREAVAARVRVMVDEDGEDTGGTPVPPAAGPSGRVGRFEVEFDEPQEAVAPGQAVVLYSCERPEVVMGGGWIARVANGASVARA